MQLVSAASPRVAASLAGAVLPLGPFGLEPARDAESLPAFFGAVRGAVGKLRGARLEQAAAAVGLHLDYLAGKAGIGTEALLDGAPLAIDEQYVLDAVANISATLALAAPLLPAPEEAGIPAPVLDAIRAAEASLQGWCSRQKSLAIARTVLEARPDTCVEIGVFGGRSLIPCAAALKALGAGEVFGVESWRAEVAVAEPTNDANDAWWQAVDFAAIKRALFRFLLDLDLTAQVRIVEAPSARAAALFDRIDWLHIDGSHSVVNAAEDVLLYARRVRPGGIVVFDDVNWASTRPAREILQALCEPVATLRDPATGQELCAILRRR